MIHPAVMPNWLKLFHWTRTYYPESHFYLVPDGMAAPLDAQFYMDHIYRVFQKIDGHWYRLL